MAERLAYCREHLEWLRLLMLHEPRGYPGPVRGAAPAAGQPRLALRDGRARAGRIHADVGQQHDLCGHGSVRRRAAHARRTDPGRRRSTPRSAPVTCPREISTAEVARRHGGERAGVRRRTRPSPRRARIRHRAGGRRLRRPVLRAGRRRRLRRRPGARSGRELVRAGALLQMAAREQVDVRHPLNPEIAGVNLVMLHSGARVPGEAGAEHGRPHPGPAPAGPARDLDRLPRPVPLRHRDVRPDGRPARPRRPRPRGGLRAPQHPRHEVRRPPHRDDDGGGRSRRPAHDHRAHLGDGHARWVLEPDDPYPAGYTLPDLWPPES